MRKAVGTFFLIVGALIFVFPFYFMLMGSFKSNAEIFSMQILNLPKAGFNLQYYIGLFGKSVFGRSLINSAIVSIIFITLIIFFSSVAGFAFAKYKFPGRNVLFVALLATIMLPPQVTYIPLFILMTKLKWVSTYQALILPRLLQGFGLAFSTFLMRQYMSYVPEEILSSARVDGCRDFRIYRQIVHAHGEVRPAGNRAHRVHGHLERFHLAPDRSQQAGHVHGGAEHLAPVRHAARGLLGPDHGSLLHELAAPHRHLPGLPSHVHLGNHGRGLQVISAPIYPYVPFACALVWNRAQADASPVKVHVSFSPDWFAARMGLDMGERWHTDPVHRRRSFAAMAGALNAEFPRLRLGGDPEAIRGGLSQIANCAPVGALFGQEVLYSPSAWPENNRDLLDDAGADSEFSVIVRLQAYSNGYGLVQTDTGKGYNLSTDLANMTGTNYRTLLKCLMSLESKGLIKMDNETNIIKLVHFVNDNVYRTMDNRQSTAAKKRYYEQSADNSRKLDRIEKALDNPIVVEQGTGLVLDRVVKQ